MARRRAGRQAVDWKEVWDLEACETRTLAFIESEMNSVAIESEVYDKA